MTADGTGKGRPKAPNLILRRIREQERRETREQFAEVMLRVAGELGEDVYPDDKYVAKLETGNIRYPRPVYRRILAEVCDRPFGELGFSPPPRFRLPEGGDSGNTGGAPVKRLNRALRDAIVDSGHELPQIARKVGIHPKTVERWIMRGTIPRPQHRWKVCNFLGRDEAELWPSAVPEQGEFSSEVSHTLRRDFLGLGGVIAVANLSGLLENELNRMHITLSRASASDERIAYLEQCADDLGILCQSAAPMAALQPALAALASVRALLEERQPTRFQARLVAVIAKLSLTIGVEAFNLGQVQQAHEWHKAARYAASDAGTQYLADIALAQQAFVPLYSGKPTEVVRLITPRLDSNPSPSPAVSMLWGIKARAHAALGEKDSFRRSIGHAQDCLDHSGPEHIGPGILSFHPANLTFYETTGAVTLNDLGNSLDAAQRALALFTATDDSYDRPLVGLERACALAKADEITEACHSARSVILDPKTYHCTPVREYARKFSEEIQSASSAEAREWRETLIAIDKAN